MQWKNLFYFSHGERRALTLLLFLLTGGWILLNYPNLLGKNDPGKENPLSVIPDTIRGLHNPVRVQEKRTVNTDGKAPSKHPYSRQEKYPVGTIIELNTADTTILKKVPGIGSVFANRILKYRDLLGGFYCVEQLAEVYGIDAEKFATLHSWFCTDPAIIQKINLNTVSREDLQRQPYISFKQAGILINLRKQRELTGWEDFILLPEFPEEERKRLAPYFTFKEKTP
ncbi:MAG: helix-hairpin-helix domain-containing protein [Tannerellaceae bacterium]|nr:helix-hairpin-helix domain-containing protein [Tannerellaceae bacterium]